MPSLKNKGQILDQRKMWPRNSKKYEHILLIHIMKTQKWVEAGTEPGLRVSFAKNYEHLLFKKPPVNRSVSPQFQ